MVKAHFMVNMYRTSIIVFYVYVRYGLTFLISVKLMLINHNS